MIYEGDNQIIHEYNIKKVKDSYMRFLELKEKEVINCKDCRRLGCVADVEFDCKTGRLIAIIVPGPGKFFSCLGACTEYYIKYCNIVRIGPDIVLVDIDACDVRKIGEKNDT